MTSADQQQPQPAEMPEFIPELAPAWEGRPPDAPRTDRSRHEAYWWMGLLKKIGFFDDHS